MSIILLSIRSNTVRYGAQYGIDDVTRLVYLDGCRSFQLCGSFALCGGSVGVGGLQLHLALHLLQHLLHASKLSLLFA